VKQVVIENPVINSGFREPDRHFKFTDEGIANEVIEGRRTSSYFVPIAQPRKKKGQKQLVFDTEWTQDRTIATPSISSQDSHLFRTISIHGGKDR
jgi:type III restriction enzyme